MKYRKKPVVVEAIQLNNYNLNLVLDFCKSSVYKYGVKKNYVFIELQTLEGVLEARLGDYIIKGIQGEFYPCKPDIFEATYEKVED